MERQTLHRHRKTKARVQEDRKIQLGEVYGESRKPRSSVPWLTVREVDQKSPADMETAGTWPKGRESCSVRMVAEYWSRLLRELWNDNPETKWYEFRNIHSQTKWQWPAGSGALSQIYKKLKDKGRRDRLFVTEDWDRAVLIGFAFVLEFKRGRDRSGIFNIEPYRDFNDHGAGI